MRALLDPRLCRLRFIRAERVRASARSMKLERARAAQADG